MSSPIENLVPGSSLLHFKLVTRLGDLVRSSVWQAEDTRSGKHVAIKILTRQLPKDEAKRDALIRDLRLAAALQHPSIVSITEFVPAGDMLLMVMELVAGDTVTQRVRNGLPDKGEFFRIAYQIADALKFLHGKGLIHQNIGGESVMVMPSGQVKVVGINATNLLKRDGPSTVYQQKGTDNRAVPYMAPEQIAAKDDIAPSADIYSYGVVLYEMGTGKLPYQGGPVAELARKIVEEQPQSPKAINPNIDNAILGVMGRCLFKDPVKRYKEAKLILDDINKVEPAAAQFASELAKAAIAAAGPAKAAAAASAAKSTMLFLADVANYEQLRAQDPDAADRAAARMQQILGESVYLFDGQVVDPFGPRMIAELPNVENALEAARKGEFDFSPEQSGSERIEIRLLLHAGEVTMRDGAVTGAAVDKGCEVLAQLPPLKLFLSEDFAKRVRNLRLRDAGAKAGVKLFNIVPPEAVAAAPAAATPARAEAAAAPHAAAAHEEVPGAAPAAKKKSNVLMIAIAAVVIVLIAAGAAVMLNRKPKEVAPVATGPAPLPPATAATPRKVVVEPFAVEGADPTLADRARIVRLASIEILRSFPEVRIADATAADVSAFSARFRAGAAGPEIVPTAASTPPATGPATPAPDAASAMQSVVNWVSSRLKVPPRATTPDVYNAFADAVTAREANDKAKVDASIKTALKSDPKFLPAQLLAMHFYQTQGDDKDALEAARQVMALEPSNLEALRTVAHADLKAGDLAGAFGAYNSVLRVTPSDPESLNMLARYAVASGDTAKITAAFGRLHSMPSAEIGVHEPDLLMSAGKIDSAIDKYYEVEEKAQNNPALALKIGRASVLRRSMSIADLELKKLQTQDPNYGYHLLKAYIAAEGGRKDEAQSELKTAQVASKPGDDYWTSVADIDAMGGDTKGVFDALDKVAAAKEPTVGYVLSNPLYAYLQSDPRFVKVREKLLAQQQEIRAALANVAL